MSEASFSKGTIKAIRKRYKNHCEICLRLFTSSSSQCAHLIGAAKDGARQLAVAVDLGVISPEYRRSSAENGMVQCPNCHSLFTSKHIALSPSPEVLEYIARYLQECDKEHRKPLHEVFRLLNNAAVQRVDVDLPNVNSILPFLDLFTIVILRPFELDNISIAARRARLSTLNAAGTKFVDAPSKCKPKAPGVVQIFNVISIIDTDTHATHADSHIVPLSPKNPKFSYRRYWRLPVKPEVVLAILMERAIHVPAKDAETCEELDRAHRIYCNLRNNMVGMGPRERPKKRPLEVEHDSERGHEEGDDGEPPPLFDASIRSSRIQKSSTKKKSKHESIPKTKIVKAPRVGPRPRKTRRLNLNSNGSFLG